MTDPSRISLSDHLTGALFGSFIGDALSLAAHWNYTPENIEREFGRIEDYADPSSNPYHPGKKAGDFTHYGDQALTLMQSISAAEGYSPSLFHSQWKSMWTVYDGYVDKATKETLRNGRSSSADLGGASRIAPVLVSSHDLEMAEFLQAVRDQTSFTHGHPSVIDAAVFFALTFRKLIHGDSLEAAVAKAAKADYRSLEVNDILAEARADLSEGTREATSKRGLGCDVGQAFPTTVYLLLKYQDNVETALVENVMAGGDSAARGMLIGLILGTAYGIGSIPERLVRNLSAYRQISDWIVSRDWDDDL